MAWFSKVEMFIVPSSDAPDSRAAGVSTSASLPIGGTSLPTCSADFSSVGFQRSPMISPPLVKSANGFTWVITSDRLSPAVNSSFRVGRMAGPIHFPSAISTPDLRMIAARSGSE